MLVNGDLHEEILVNVTPRETRVAVVENGVLQEVHIERHENSGYVGNIFVGRVVRVLPGMQAAFVDIGLERAAFLHARDMQPDNCGGQEDQDETPDIRKLAHEGQRLVVQVTKDPIGSKGARLTTNLSIPARYLVLLPSCDHIGLSARLEEAAERERLREIVKRLRGEHTQHGYIVRTNADGASEAAIAADMQFLDKLWSCIREEMHKVPAGSCIYEDLPLTRRVVRDLLGPQVDKLRIDSRETFAKTRKFASQFMPEYVERIEHYSGARPIFDLYGVEDEIQHALQRTAPLKSGGYIVIDQTEAMTTIDVNTGGFVGHRNLEETIYKTNLEAAQTIARQLRLRNLGGIIIIDFIDMQEAMHRKHVLEMLERCLERDHAKTQVYSISSLGLVEMTRKRTTESLQQQLCEPCACCNGRGFQKTPATLTYEIFREIMRSVRQFEAEKLLVLAAPVVVDYILDEESDALADLSAFIDKEINFQPEEQYSQEQYDVVLI